MIRYGIGALLAFIAASAHADGNYISPTNDRVRVSLGIMDVISSTTLSESTAARGCRALSSMRKIRSA